ncbi:MAG: hypothetical protein GY906_26060 [bacterium]|nr:hypothetical protein [bacterium]
MGKRVAVITREKQRQFEALRTGLGLLLEHHNVSLFVLDHEIDSDEHFLDNLGFIDEMGGNRYSNHPANVESYGFRSVSLQETGNLLSEHDLVVPF